MAGRQTGQGRTAAAGGSRTGAPSSGASEIGFAEIPAVVSAPFATLPPEVIYRREKERRALTGADAISSAMEEARREFAAMLAADRPKGTGGRPAKNGRGRPAAATQPVVADELDHSGPEVEEITLGAVGDLDEVDAAIDPVVEEVEVPEEVEVVTRRPAAAAAAAPTTRRAAGTGTKRTAKAPAAPVRGKATTSSGSSRSTAQTRRRRQSARPAAAPARSKRGAKATASSSSGGRRGGSAPRTGARGSKR